jgi:hypothetical protein
MCVEGLTHKYSSMQLINKPTVLVEMILSMLYQRSRWLLGYVGHLRRVRNATCGAYSMFDGAVACFDLRAFGFFGGGSCSSLEFGIERPKNWEFEIFLCC